MLTRPAPHATCSSCTKVVDWELRHSGVASERGGGDLRVNHVSENKHAPEAAVAALAHEIVELINTAPLEQREGLREDAVALLRNEVDMSGPPVEAEMRAAATFNPFGIGIPLALMGTVLVFLFPPVGLLLFAIAGVVGAWGVGATLLARR